jgi:hypothetical protein
LEIGTRWIAPAAPTAAELPSPAPVQVAVEDSQPKPVDPPQQNAPPTAAVEVRPQTVEEPSLAEQMGDSVPSSGDTGKNGRKAAPASPAKKSSRKTGKPTLVKADAITEILNDDLPDDLK